MFGMFCCELDCNGVGTLNCTGGKDLKDFELVMRIF